MYFTINQASEGVAYNSTTKTYSYNLPFSVTGTKGELIVFAVLEDYPMFVSAITDGIGIINSSETPITVTRKQGISSLEIKDGKLCWTPKDKDSYTDVTVDITYQDGASLRRIVFKVDDTTSTYEGGKYYYTFQDTEYNFFNTEGKAKIVSGIAYSIKMYVNGKNGINPTINSEYSKTIVAERLKQLTSTDITVLHNNATVPVDTLTWTAVEGAVAYNVVLTGTSHVYTFTVTGATSVDLSKENLAVDTYSVTIRAMGDGYISSLQSEVFDGLKKLNKVESIWIDNNLICWSAVTDAEKYKVVITYEGEEPIYKETSSTSCVAPEGYSGKYTIDVYAIGNSAKLLASEKKTYTTSSSQPEPVGTITYNDGKFYFDVATDFEPTTDTINISYDLRTASLSATNEIIYEPTATNYTTTISGVAGKVTYSFEPLVMGKYSNFKVYIGRAGTLPSTTREYDSTVTVDWFASGDGSAENPYTIVTKENLLNIARRTNDNYSIMSSIDLGSVDIASRLANYKALICETFTGSLDGNGNRIYGMNYNLNNVKEFALFKTISGATIKNIEFGWETENTVITSNYTTAQT
ncbi:MAG: hypothetical protein MJ149_00850, partial [Clostridia bacterium]|nr:hypothetical protein [Clostridia bacterium]